MQVVDRVGVFHLTATWRCLPLRLPSEINIRVWRGNFFQTRESIGFLPAIEMVSVSMRFVKKKEFSGGAGNRTASVLFPAPAIKMAGKQSRRKLMFQVFQMIGFDFISPRSLFQCSGR